MRSLILTFACVLCLVTQVYAQISISLLERKDTTTNVLYLGRSSFVYIRNLPADAKVTFNGHVLERLSRNQQDYPVRGNYDLQPENEADNTIRIYRSGKEIYKYKYAVKRLKDIRVILGLVKDSSATIDEILSCPKLRAFIPDCDLIEHFDILNYTISINKGQGRQIIYSKKPGALYADVTFNANVINDIKLLKKGDSIIVGDIKIVGAILCPRYMGPIVITIR